jgi:hypothetical protein
MYSRNSPLLDLQMKAVFMPDSFATGRMMALSSIISQSQFVQDAESRAVCLQQSSAGSTCRNRSYPIR